jgi:hypothetical protein
MSGLGLSLILVDQNFTPRTAHPSNSGEGIG